MSLPSVSEVRSRIESIPDKPIRHCLQAQYLFCARPGEVAAYKQPSDKGTTARGSLLRVKTMTYTPDLYNEKEIQTLMLTALVEGRQVGLQDLSKIREPAAIFQVSTHKRLGMIREVALPLNPKYEPWTKPLVDYFNEQKEGAVFPFNRQQMWTAATQAFSDLNYKIMAYKKVIGKTAEDKPIKRVIPEHMRQFKLQALRHLRGSELRNFYNFDGADRSAYGGWTLRTTEGVSGSQDRYVELPWRSYFPKLLRKHG